MKQHIRYVDCGKVSPEMYLVLQEYDNVLELTEPLLLNFSADRTLVDFWQGPYWDEKNKEWKLPFSDLSEYFNAPELSDIFICRPYVKLELPYDAEMSYYVTSPYITNFSMFYPGIGRVKEDKDKRQKIYDLFHNTIQQILNEKYNIEVEIGKEGSGNDVYYKHNGNLKKFIGSLYRHGYGSNWNQGVIDMSITYKFDAETANIIRKFDGGIRVKKFDVDDIQEKVGGLWEVNSSIRKNELEMEWVNRVCKSLNFSIRQDTLTKEEELKLFEWGKRRLTEKEWYLHGNNENFEIRY